MSEEADPPAVCRRERVHMTTDKTRHAIQAPTAETAARIHAEVTAQAASLLALLMIERDEREAGK
jgi:hypothetical protein